MSKITVCVASWNAAYSLALMWESTLYYNPGHEFSLMVLDNGSWDGAKEYAERHADMLLLGNNTKNHGWALTECIRRVETEYLLTMDNDCFFLKHGAIDFMLERLTDKALCVCPERPCGADGKGVPYGQNYTIEWSPNIACGLFRTSVIQNICRHFHLGYYGDLVSERVYETGGLVWRVGQAMGLDSVEPKELWNGYMRHEGAQSTLWAMCRNYPDPAEVEEAKRLNPIIMGYAINGYERIKRELAGIRGCTVETLDEHEPPSKGPAQFEDLKWAPPQGTHVKLIPGAGVR